jgi:predicted GNAT family N-acyltransferase
MATVIKVKKLEPHDPDLEKAFAIRKTVFVDEQHCLAELEFEFNDVSTHFIARCNEIPCGAARWRKTEKGFKLERFAVLPEFRGLGVGAHLVKAILADIPKGNFPVYLNAQLPVLNFYTQFGFRPVGENFEEAGIMHQQMIRVSQT